MFFDILWAFLLQKGLVMPTIQTVVRPRRNRISLVIPEAYRSYSFQVILVPFKDDTPKKYDFSDLTGHLKWKGDAVSQQRRMRDDW